MQESGRHSTSAQDVTGNGREKNGKDNNDLEAGPSGTPDGGADMLQFFNEVRPNACPMSVVVWEASLLSLIAVMRRNKSDPLFSSIVF